MIASTICENLDPVDLIVSVLWPILRAKMCQMCNFENFDGQYLKKRLIDSEIFISDDETQYLLSGVKIWTPNFDLTKMMFSLP